MSGINENKIQSQKPPNYEDAINNVESGAIASKSASAAFHEKQRKKRIKIILALIGIMAFYFMLYSNVRWRPKRIRPPGIRQTWESRRRWIDSGGQTLDGDFDLFDILSIRSSFGAVHAHIHPQPANESNPQPAELQISSQSGVVNIDFTALKAPQRDYYTSIFSYSGSINGALLHGRKTVIEAHAAEALVELTLFRAADLVSTLSTSTTSGFQEITILNPANDKEATVKEMTSTHSAESGSLILQYPTQWEGTIEGRTQSGDLQLIGEGIEIVRQSSYGPAGQYVLARKGNGNSTLNFQTGSGRAVVHFA